MFSAQFYQEIWQNVLQRNLQVIHMNAQAEFQEHEPYTVHSTLIEPEMNVFISDLNFLSVPHFI